MRSSTLPDGLPILSRGRHRSPRQGACFMELVSLLAGERWSDHPACTHPLLAQLAQQVNDSTSDVGRHDLLPLVAAVVDRRGNDQTWVRLAVAVASNALLEVPEGEQRVLAGGLLRAERVCVEDGAPSLDETRAQARAALEHVPDAVSWIHRLTVGDRITPRSFATWSAPTIVRCAVDGIVASGRQDCDQRLRSLLEVGIAACPAPPRVGASSAAGVTVRLA